MTIKAIGDQGDGIAKFERGYVLIVPDSQPGEQPTVEIEQVQENVAFASVVHSDPRAQLRQLLHRPQRFTIRL